MKIKALAFVAAVAISGVSTASAVDGTINFTGTIQAGTCTIASIAGADSTTGTVSFGQLNSATLDNPGTTTISTPFSIELKDCAVSAAPAITFNGEAVSTAPYTHLFRSGVTGVGIRIADAESGTNYTSGNSAANSGLNLLTSDTVRSATGNFNAYLVAYDDSTKSGEVDTSVTFTIDYSES